MPQMSMVNLLVVAFAIVPIIMLGSVRMLLSMLLREGVAHNVINDLLDVDEVCAVVVEDSRISDVRGTKSGTQILFRMR